MLVFMPKYVHYTAIPDRMIHTVNSNIETVIKKFVQDDDVVDVFIEDEFATNYFKNKRIFTCTRQRELSSISSLGIYGEYMASMEAMYPAATQYTLEFKKAKMPEMKLMYTNRDLYTKQYIKYYTERAHDCIQTLAKERKVAIVFTYRGKNDNPIVPAYEENDSILYIYCDIETGVISGYYSGIWINSDMIDQIVGGIYNGQRAT